ncbi:MAG: ABC transporter ATP-binding protein [Oscillospiraceae bacterium]|nr:ABC transporter ATP-binding protein [Oscillospiraceae bacterium]
MYELENESAETKLDTGVWKRLYRYAMRNRRTVFTILAYMLVTAGCDILFPLMARYAIDTFIVPESGSGFGAFCALYAVMVLLQGVCVWRFVHNGGKLEMSMSYDIRAEAFHKLQELSFSFYDRTAVGYLLARMVSDVSRLSEMVAWSFVDVIWSAAFIVGCFGVMFVLNVKLALIILLIVPPLAISCWFFQKKILKLQRVVRKTNSKITGAFNEGIMGAMTTKTLVREQRNLDEFTQLTSRMKHASVRSAVLSATFVPVVLLIGSVGTALALSEGGRMVAAGAIGLGTLAAFVNYTTQLFDPIQQLARVLAEFQSAQASAERVLNLIDTPCEIVEKPEVVEKFGDNFHPKRENWPPIEGGVEFRNVSFSYIEGEQVLDDFSLKVRPGETIALVGETGAGKSTIVNLVCRFYEPTSGQILIDGVDYRERSSLWLEESLGYVLQTPHLFSGSVADNIRYGKRGATMDEVVAAAKLVRAHEFISQLRDGYDSEVGAGGALLSTGQKQLISFARVVLADPRIFVLDEATSSVDTETERLIQHAITHVLKGRTSFIVAHRLSTIRSADRILVVRGGRITEQGTHAELMRQGGYYCDLYTNQFRTEKSLEAFS